MKLKLTVRREADVRTDLDVTADASATVGDLAGALFLADPLHAGAQLPGPVTLHVWDGHSGRALEPSTGVLDSGLRSGSTVTVVPHSDRFGADDAGRGPVVASIRVLTGPDVGREFGLPFGSAVVGRDRDVDVRLSDPMVSKRHARFNVSDSVEVVDLASANGVLVDGQQTSRRVIGPGEVVTLGDTELAVVQHQRAGGAPPATPDVPVLRSPRVVPRFAPREVPAPEPPKRNPQSRFPVLMIAAPVLLGVALFLLTKNTSSLYIVAFSPVFALGTWWEARLDQRRQAKEFTAAIAALRADLLARQERERAVRLVEHPSTAEAVDAAQRHGELLWTRRPEHLQFATLRLGLGTAPSRTRVRLPEANETQPKHWAALTALAGELATIDRVPVVADLRECGCLGVAGEGARPAAASLVAQLVALHSPAEVVVAAFVSSQAAPDWRWLAWLPHTSSPHSPIGGRLLAADHGSASGLLSRLEVLVAGRRGEPGVPSDLRGPLGPEAEPRPAPVVATVVVVVENGAPADRARLTRLAELGPSVGVYVLWVGAVVGDLPAACRSHLHVAVDGSAVVGDVRWGARVEPVTCETIDAASAELLARALAPTVDAGVPLDDDSDLPRSVSYLALSGDLTSGPEQVVERWRQTGSVSLPDGSRPRLRADAGLRALVGHAGSELFRLDLRAQGPHALVGGTTGAGKSEFLQSWVLGLAAAYSPQRVTFLLVDYKGGAAFADCVDLPHCVGLVTDLSPHLVRRALTSLRAELRYRERVLERKKAKDLLSLERAGDPDTPPALVVVVDEFAALVSEVPEFVDGMVDVAQRGRSLGLHLVLATQRPAGVIKDNLRANTNLRVALRMADADDSTDILGVPDAAGFDPAVPGRGAMKAGPGRIVAFQTGYAGGWTTAAPPRPRIDVVELGLGEGAVWEVPELEAAPADSHGLTDIARIVATVRSAADVAGIEPPRRPWLDELAPAYDVSRLRQRSDDELAIGVVDDPTVQDQRTVYWRPDQDGNLGVYGTGGSGKSTVLRTIATSAAVTPRGGPVHVYALDFGSRGLDMLSELPHVGAVIDGDDDERVRRLLRFLRSTVDERAARYGALRADSVAAYRSLSGVVDEPRIVLLVDGVGAFQEAYDVGPFTTPFATFEQIATDGRPVGVHVVVSADRPGAVPISIRSTLQRRLVLRQADQNDYGMLDVAGDIVGPGSPPGRGILDALEVQVAVLGGSASLTEQSRRLRALARSMREAGRVGAVTPIGRLSDDVRLGSLPVDLGGPVLLGLDDLDLGAWGIAPDGIFLVAGPPGSGRSTALATIASAMRRSVPGARLMYLGKERSAVRQLGLWDAVALTDLAIIDLAASLRGALDGPRMVVVIEDVPAFVDSAAESELDSLVVLLAEHGHLVVAEGELSRLTQYSPLLQSLRGARRGIVLQPDQNDGDSIFRTDFPRASRRDFPPGRGIATERGKTWRVQLARP
ncbi:FtsK/SpoIIIE domain-containing protein [Pengzhenrongella sicca]|uniref:FHA domain-containing protein n=1 Tax=Pengzhenrongella sicca TaxID=2819238 RepID=A0A8A4ZH71_9MICO|nr:FtsK/SpoIIIE domain-containing protein [Pengzhenrongella sicca]QTE28988.1 FHA domain-containing protein [Pengzhenrongella sicca]